MKKRIEELKEKIKNINLQSADHYYMQISEYKEALKKYIDAKNNLEKIKKFYEKKVEKIINDKLDEIIEIQEKIKELQSKIKFKEYTDNGDNYRTPIQESSNEEIEIRLYCNKKECNKYIKGILGYNGKFVAETGHTADLRDQVWHCLKHLTLIKK